MHEGSGGPMTNPNTHVKLCESCHNRHDRRYACPSKGDTVTTNANLPAPSNTHATCAWCRTDFATIVELIDHVDAGHAPNVRPMRVIPPAQVRELSEFDIAFDSGELSWKDDMPTFA
jgi:hypothetical protein